MKLLSRIGIAVGLMLLVGLSVTLSTSPAFAFNCTVPDKQDGAGAVGPDDLIIAGQSGNLVAPGAFIDPNDFEEIPFDIPEVFIRGPRVEDVPATVVGEGSLPHQPHDNGGSEHGVQSLLGP